MASLSCHLGIFGILHMYVTVTLGSHFESFLLQIVVGVFLSEVLRL